MSGLGRRVRSFNLILIFYSLLTGHGAGEKEKWRRRCSKNKAERAFPLKPILFNIYFILKKFVQVNVC